MSFLISAAVGQFDHFQQSVRFKGASTKVTGSVKDGWSKKGMLSNFVGCPRCKKNPWRISAQQRKCIWEFMHSVTFLPPNICYLVVSNIFHFHPYLGKWSNLTNIFQMGWNHQLVCVWKQQVKTHGGHLEETSQTFGASDKGTSQNQALQRYCIHLWQMQSIHIFIIYTSHFKQTTPNNKITHNVT